MLSSKAAAPPPPVSTPHSPYAKQLGNNGWATAPAAAPFAGRF
jgi:hypothetical protein